ncbi:MAG TPA: NifU family protein [Candidatus Sumerlaeota bacterium]|nr:NifU family protein [Candidatus Sumerlaeota bacterium]HOR26398.1 NifU family protein [Candidatus Sumerlaeota bacterium]HPK02962.1 NifU family protein [Candidatus Sumerlaeota bacterium]
MEPPRPKADEILIRPEPTPNPDSVRFIVSERLLEGGTADLKRSASALERSPLARKIFDACEDVQGVFLGPDFVTITARETADWPTIADAVDVIVRQHLAAGEPVLLGDADAAHGAAADTEVARGIARIIDAEIRPAVAMDGGDVIFGGYEDGIVSLYLRGACHGCPSSMMTLKMGIERRLKEEFPEIVSVEAI